MTRTTSDEEPRLTTAFAITSFPIYLLMFPSKLPQVYQKSSMRKSTESPQLNSTRRLRPIPVPPSTGLDLATGQLKVERAHHSCLSEPFRLGESRKWYPIWLNQVLAQQDGHAERSRDHNRAHPFAVAEDWEDRLRGRNASKRTSNLHGSRRAEIAPEKIKITKPPRSLREDGIGPFGGGMLGTEPDLKRPHCAVTAISQSQRICFLFRLLETLRSDSSGAVELAPPL